MRERHELTKRVRVVEDLETVAEAPPSPRPSYNYGVGNTGGEEEVHLRDYWRSIRKRLWLVISIAVIVTMLSAIYMARKPDIFEAQARVQVDLENNPAMGASKNGSIIVNSPVNDPAYFNTQLQILTSSGLLRRVVKTLDLEHDQAFIAPQINQNRSTWQNLLRMFGLGGRNDDAQKKADVNEIPILNQTEIAPPVESEDLTEAKRLAGFVGAIQGSLKVEPVKDTRLSVRETRLIDIRYSHSDPQVAARIVNAVAATFVRSNLERKSETNNSAGVFLQQRIAELQRDIRKKEEELVSYAKDHQILSLDQSQNTVVERLAGLNRQLLEAENQRKEAEAAYRAALAPGAVDALSESSTIQISTIEAKLADLKAKRDGLLTDVTEEYPDVQDISEQITILEKYLKDLRSRSTTVVSTNLETRYRQALAKEESLRKAFNEQRGETMVQNEAAINYNIIKQEIETNKQLLDGLLQRNKENEVILAGTPNNIHVLDYAITPDGPVGPRRMQSVMLAFFLSLGFGVGLALFLEYFDDTVSSAEDVEKTLRLPALSVIPSSVNSTRRRRLLPNVNALQRANGNGNSSSELLLNVDPRSPLAEAYRQLRTSVLLSTAGRAPKTLLVTSSLPSEGKTTTAVNLAISLAQTGASVLVIDADMRRPRVHSIFDINKQHGLSTILSSDVSDADVFSMIEQHEVSGLHLLTSGAVPPNPAELIGSEQMRKLITTLESTFTHIVVDSPPIASFTDGVLLASMVDGVLLVVHGGKSSRNVIKRSRQLLQDVGAKVLGVVLNNVDLRSHDYYYYRTYYTQSYYKADAAEADNAN